MQKANVTIALGVGMALLLVLLGADLGLRLAEPRAVQAQGLQHFRTVPDITGTGTPVALASSGACLWIQIYAPSTNVNPVRFGDVNISTSRGSMIEKGYGEFTPSFPGQKTYEMATSYVLVQSGDKATVLCGF